MPFLLGARAFLLLPEPLRRGADGRGRPASFFFCVRVRAGVPFFLGARAFLLLPEPLRRGGRGADGRGRPASFFFVCECERACRSSWAHVPFLHGGQSLYAVVDVVVLTDRAGRHGLRASATACGRSSPAHVPFLRGVQSVNGVVAVVVVLGVRGGKAERQTHGDRVGRGADHRHDGRGRARRASAR